MSHIEEFLEAVATPTAAHRRGDITSVWDCYNAASKSAKIYRSQVKTPRRRISYYAGDMQVAAEEQEHKKVLESMVSVQWHVYRCSPLWNVKWKSQDKNTARKQNTSSSTNGDLTINVMRMLENQVSREYDEKELKRYGRIIAGYVATHSVSGQDIPYKVELEAIKGLKGSTTDNDALKITVYTSMFDEEKQIFLGLLCGIEAAEIQTQSIDCVNLPVFLTVGNADTRERVIYGLEKCFDCNIAPMILPDEELRWMSAMWAGLELEETDDVVDDDIEQSDENVKGEKSKKKGKVKKKPKRKALSKEFKMSFAVPECHGSSKKIRHITCVYPIDQIIKVWKHIHSSSDSEFADTEMEQFHSLMRNFIKTDIKIDLEALELIQISLPIMKAGRAGIVRFESCDHVKVVLRYMTELCQGNMFQADPTLSALVQDNTMEWDN